MAADLHPLIRVKRHALEEKQKFLAQLYEKSETLEAAKTKLLNDRDAELERAKEMPPDMLSYLGPYVEGVKDKVAQIDEDMASLNKRIDIAREDMRAAFADVKKLEITQETREAEEQAERDKKETDELDEIAINGFRRSQED